MQTDVFKLTFDTEGGSLVHSEFVKHVDLEDKAAVKAGTAKGVVLLDDSKDRVYVAQTGLVGAGQLANAQNHHDRRPRRSQTGGRRERTRREI